MILTRFTLLERGLQGLKIHPIYIFPNLNVCGLIYVLQFVTLHSSLWTVGPEGKALWAGQWLTGYSSWPTGPGPTACMN